MKKTLFVLCLLSSAAAFAQSYGGGYSINTQPMIFEAPSHPAHASYTAMSGEQTVLANSSYTSAQGERPFSDFPQVEPVPLGTAARELKKQRAELKRSRVVWINQ